jgi:hypothetical protein
VCDGKFSHPHTVDRAAESMWMTEYIHMFWSCVTLGFSNSVEIDITAVEGSSYSTVDVKGLKG